MKIISLVSSYRKNGNTERVVRLFEEQILLTADEFHVPVEFERISLGHADIKICRGCRACFDKGEEKCPLKDDLLAIRDKILEADGIIAASPVYVEDINGIMKNWIDRMAFLCHRQAFAGKTALAITTSGGASSNHALNTMKRALISWGVQVAGQGKFRTGSLMKTEEIKARHQNKTSKAADHFFRAIKKECVIPSFYSLVVFKVYQSYWHKSKKKNTYDFAYWQNKGWIEPRSTFYIAHKANWIKVKLARLVGGIVALFFLSE